MAKCGPKVDDPKRKAARRRYTNPADVYRATRDRARHLDRKLAKCVDVLSHWIRGALDPDKIDATAERSGIELRHLVAFYNGDGDLSMGALDRLGYVLELTVIRQCDIIEPEPETADSP